jgi:hypothetical protein
VKVGGRARKRTFPSAEAREDRGGRLLVFCHMERTEINRLDGLARRVRVKLGEHAGRVPKPELISALVLSGLDLALNHRADLVVKIAHGVRVEYRLTPADLARIEVFRQSELPKSALRMSRGKVQAAMVRLALRHAEKNESFITADLIPRLPRALLEELVEPPEPVVR